MKKLSEKISGKCFELEKSLENSQKFEELNNYSGKIPIAQNKNLKKF